MLLVVLFLYYTVPCCPVLLYIYATLNASHISIHTLTTLYIHTYTTTILNIYTLYHICSVLSLYKVNPNSGTLDICLNIPRIPTQSLSFLKHNGKIYQGGNAQILHTLLEISSGKQLLYIGDHIFADILRSKRSLGWSTCLIVPELTLEVRKYTETIGKYQELMELKQKQCALEERLDEFYRKGLTGGITSIAITNTANSSSGSGHKNENTSVSTEVEVEVECREEYSALEKELQELREEIRERLAQYDAVFHTRWGQVDVV